MDKIIYLDPDLNYADKKHIIVQVINPTGSQTLEGYIEMAKVIQKDFPAAIDFDILCGKLSKGGLFHNASTIVSYSGYVKMDVNMPEGWKVSHVSEIHHEW